MAGLTTTGFIPDTLKNIKDRIETRIKSFNGGFDFDPESPDGQLIGIVSAELALLWNELGRVYRSYDPNSATGQGLRNIALLTGVEYRTATRSLATIRVLGQIGTLIPAGSYVSTLEGYKFFTATDVTIGASNTYVDVIASKYGPVPVTTGSIINTDSVVTGWDSVIQEDEGQLGEFAESETAFRNLRNRTVLRNSISVEESLQAKLIDAGVDQVFILNNDDDASFGSIPPRTIHVTIGETNLTDQEVAKIIYEGKGLGTPTYGSVLVVHTDSLGHTHNIYFDKALERILSINLNITFLSEDIAGKEELIKQALLDHVDALLVGEDVIWSHLFGLITPHGDAQINSLELILDGNITAPTNAVIGVGEFASLIESNINITVN